MIHSLEVRESRLLRLVSDSSEMQATGPTWQPTFENIYSPSPAGLLMSRCALVRADSEAVFY